MIHWNHRYWAEVARMLGMGRLVNCRLLPSYVAWLCNQGLANSNKYRLVLESASVTKPHTSHHHPDSMEPILSKIKHFIVMKTNVLYRRVWALTGLCLLTVSPDYRIQLHPICLMDSRGYKLWYNEVEIRLIISYQRSGPRNQSPARENVNHSH